MKFTLVTDKNADLKGVDGLFVPVLNRPGKTPLFGALFSLLTVTEQDFLRARLAKRELKAGNNQIVDVGSGCVFLVAESSWDEKKIVFAVRKFIRQAKGDGSTTIAFSVDDWKRNGITPDRAAVIITENTAVAHYDFSHEFKTAPEGGWKNIKQIRLYANGPSKKIEIAVAEAEAIGSAVNHCRTLSNYPPSDLSPEGMAEAARTAGRGLKNLTVTVFDEKKLASEGMNAILAVGKGSASAPRLIIMEYRGTTVKEKPVAFVGKGVTFDSGGLNIKPGESMADMHMDMSGGAAVIYAVALIAQLKLKVNVIGLVPAVENMPSGISYRQGDIIRAYGGKTIEVGNTDAEGRVILADAIEYAKTKNPALIVTLATLTGSAMGALGLRSSALFVKNNRPLQKILEDIGTQTGDSVWPLPLPDESDKDVEGNIADVINTHRTNSRYGGAITGAAFLWQFAKPTPFAHIDMAPRMTSVPEEDILNRGALGFGVRYFLELARERAVIKKLVKG